MEIKAIIEGYTNLLFDSNNKKEISDKRMEICNSCPFKKPITCGVCGCRLDALTKAFTQKECPKQKWKKVIVKNKVVIDDGLIKE